MGPRPTVLRRTGDAVSVRSSPTCGGLSLPDSARQREQAAALDAALQHSSAEVRDLLSALDLAAESRPGSAASIRVGGSAPPAGAAAAAAAVEAAVVAARAALAAAHERVQSAARRMQEAAGDAEQLKQQHAGLREQVGQRMSACTCAHNSLLGAVVSVPCRPSAQPPA